MVFCNSLFQSVAMNVTHGVEWKSFTVHPKGIDRNDAWMFQLARDCGFSDEPLSDDGIICQRVKDPFDDNLAVQVLVFGDMYLTHSAFGQRPNRFITSVFN